MEGMSIKNSVGGGGGPAADENIGKELLATNEDEYIHK
jgi:hypothetical protein